MELQYNQIQNDPLPNINHKTTGRKIYALASKKTDSIKDSRNRMIDVKKKNLPERESSKAQSPEQSKGFEGFFCIFRSRGSRRKQIKECRFLGFGGLLLAAALLC